MAFKLFTFLTIFNVIAVKQILLYKILAETEEYVLLNEEKHPCIRTCVKGAPPMVCRYHFAVEWYETMSRACYDCPRNITDCYRPDCIPGDGISRPVIAINRKMPGPGIEVCEGDEVIVDVANHLHNEETAIHWHGHHQRGTPYMDGVPHITQCPISSGTTFRYHFKAQHKGTHFWHSHSGLQRGDGAFGPMIVRSPKEDDPHKPLYDLDLSSHVIIVLDWLHEAGLSKFLIHHHSDGDNKPETLLINGMGLFQMTNGTGDVPPAKFIVEQGYRYRFRVINAGFLNCPIEISIDNHTLTIISSDGNDFEPIAAESVVTYAGERWDFIVNADKEIDNYWMRFRGLMDCDERFTSAHQVGILHYKGAELDTYPEGETDYESSHKDGLQVNAINEGTDNNGTLVIPELNALIPDDESLKEVADYQFYISYDFYKKFNPHFYSKGLYEYFAGHRKFKLTTPQLNHISMKLQPFPLLPARNQITPGMFCNESTVQNCEEDYCECTHVLEVKLGSVVELVLVDKGVTFDANHPFHLHGNVFRVVAMERIGSNTTVEEVKELDRMGLIDRKLSKAPVKDTVTVPDGGYTILRFHANNPGYWFFHCHIDFHAEIGMAIVFKIGEHSDMPPVPKNFPQCGNYLPETEESPVKVGGEKNPVNNQNDSVSVIDIDVSANCTETAVHNSTNESVLKKLWNSLYKHEDCDTTSGAKHYNFGNLILIFSVILVLINF